MLPRREKVGGVRLPGAQENPRHPPWNLNPFVVLPPAGQRCTRHTEPWNPSTKP